jgi:hypothetical protein
MLPDDLELDDQVIIVLGKGRRPRAVPFGRKTALALDRCLRLRASHQFAHLPNLWIGRAGAMTPSGLFQVVADRGASVGLPGRHPHQFRHSFADAWLSAGGNEGDLMRRHTSTQDLKHGEVAMPGHESISPAERSLRARLAAYALHSQRDPRETTAKARAAFLAKFEREADPKGVLPLEERRRRAESLRRAHFARLALGSVKARRKAKGSDGVRVLLRSLGSSRPCR